MWLTWKLFLLLLPTYSMGWSNSLADSTFQIKQLPFEGLLLDTGWKYKVGDNPEWASPQWNDSDWQKIDPTEDIHGLPQLWSNDIGWFRLQFTVNSKLRRESLALLVEQTGASEIYLNGQLIAKYGQFATQQTGVQASYPLLGSLFPFSRITGRSMYWLCVSPYRKIFPM